MEPGFVPSDQTPANVQRVTTLVRAPVSTPSLARSLSLSFPLLTHPRAMRSYISLQLTPRESRQLQIKSLMVAAADKAIEGVASMEDGSVAHQMTIYIYAIIKEELKKAVGGDVFLSDSRVLGFGDGSKDHIVSSMHAT